jgi:chromosome segregation ATPase
MDIWQQLIVSLGPVALGLLAVWRLLVQARIKREEEDRNLRQYFKAELATRDAKIEERDCRLDELRDAQFASQQHIARLVSEIQDEQRHRQQSDERADLSHRNFLKLQAQTADLTLQLNAAQAQAAEIAPLRAEIDTLKRRLNELTFQLDLKIKENEDLHTKNSKLAAENREYERRIVGLNARINELETHVAMLANRVGSLERENHQLKQEVSEIGEEESS